MKNITSSVGEMILSLRKEKGITQEVLAQNIGVSVQAVSKWETNASSPDINLLPLIADYFDISLDTLFGRRPTGDKKVNSDMAGLKGPELFGAILNRCWELELDSSFSNHTQEDVKKMSSGGNDFTSRLIVNEGFTNMKNGLGFAVVPNPKDGWRALFDNDDICELFKYLSNKNFMKVLSFLTAKNDYNFTLEGLSGRLKIDKSELAGYINALVKYRLIEEKKVVVDEGQSFFYIFSVQMLPLLLVALVYAREFINQKQVYSFYCWNREKPFI